MLKLIGWLIKASLFAAVVLVLGNLIHWRGQTVSDQVKTQLTRAEKSPTARKIAKEAKDVTLGYTNDINTKTKSVWPRSAVERYHASSGSPERAEAARKQDPSPERIAPSERQKLRSLIHDLNNGRDADISAY
ncbi:MAG: hypothetical protein P4M08_14435 [Oligoflexia bacterium]|nr:hypothetical protein [Oligoflexia bacterium]